MNKKIVKTEEGVVIKAKMEKSCIVNVRKTSKAPFYGKIIAKNVKYYVHNSENKAKAGDKVLIKETRPISKTIRWTVSKILEKSKDEGLNYDTNAN